MLQRKKPTILVVEDHAELNEQLVRAFHRKYRVDRVTTLSGAFNYLAEETTSYDVVLLDQHLPDGSGFDLIPFVQKDNPNTKICVFTQSAQDTSRISALQLGADAFLTKPLSPHCLSLHVQALLRRGTPISSEYLMFADLCYNCHTRRASRNSDEIRLSKRESDFLHAFIKSGDGVVSKEDLQRIYWKKGQQEITKSAIHVTIQRLRRKLKSLRVEISSIYGLGYRLSV